MIRTFWEVSKSFFSRNGIYREDRRLLTRTAHEDRKGADSLYIAKTNPNKYADLISKTRPFGGGKVLAEEKKVSPK